MPKHLVISTSGNPDSNSRRMGRVAFAHLQKKQIDCDWIDIREMDLPLCDADKCYGMPGSKKLSAAIENADGILVAAPVYNYDVAAAAKNMIELTGSAWENKIVGFFCAAGGAKEADNFVFPRAASQLDHVFGGSGDVVIVNRCSDEDAIGVFNRGA